MKVKLRSNNVAAANATDITIKALGFNSYIVRDSSGNILFDTDGLAQVKSDNPGYIAFALKHQGYVNDVLGEDDD